LITYTGDTSPVTPLQTTTVGFFSIFEVFSALLLAISFILVLADSAMSALISVIFLFILVTALLLVLSIAEFVALTYTLVYVGGVLALLLFIFIFMPKHAIQEKFEIDLKGFKFKSMMARNIIVLLVVFAITSAIINFLFSEVDGAFKRLTEEYSTLLNSPTTTLTPDF